MTAWNEWLAHAKTREPTEEVRQLTYREWVAVLEAAMMLKEIIGSCETRPGPFHTHISVPKDLYKRARRTAL